MIINSLILDQIQLEDIIPNKKLIQEQIEINEIRSELR